MRVILFFLPGALAMFPKWSSTHWSMTARTTGITLTGTCNVQTSWPVQLGFSATSNKYAIVPFRWLRNYKTGNQGRGFQIDINSEGPCDHGWCIDNQGECFAPTGSSKPKYCSNWNNDNGAQSGFFNMPHNAGYEQGRWVINNVFVRQNCGTTKDSYYNTYLIAPPPIDQNYITPVRRSGSNEISLKIQPPSVPNPQNWIYVVYTIDLPRNQYFKVFDSVVPVNGVVKLELGSDINQRDLATVNLYVATVTSAAINQNTECDGPSRTTCIPEDQVPVTRFDNSYGFLSYFPKCVNRKFYPQGVGPNQYVGDGGASGDWSGSDGIDCTGDKGYFYFNSHLNHAPHIQVVFKDPFNPRNSSWIPQYVNMSTSSGFVGYNTIGVDTSNGLYSNPFLNHTVYLGSSSTSSDFSK